MVALILCVVLLVALLVGYYMLYLRHRLMYRYGLEQVVEINRRALEVPAFGLEDGRGFASKLVEDLFKELNELVAMECLGIAIRTESQQELGYVFSSSDFERMELMKEGMERCWVSGTVSWDKESRMWCLPLEVETQDGKQRLGVMALCCVSENGREDDRLMLELVANYVSIVVYNAVELVAQKYRDIETAQDEANRVLREENLLHVQNMVLDNCLSTIKHETIYYPNRIKQIVDRLRGGITGEEERRHVETMSELIGYYKGIFTMLSSCAARQLEEVTFRRGVVKAENLAEFAGRYLKRATRKLPMVLEMEVKAEPVVMTGDAVLLKLMLENLVNEALLHEEDGRLELHIYKEGAFVRFDFIDRRREFSQEELNQLFYPHLSRIQNGREGNLMGTEYLVCKQVVREHDEFAGRRGCRMNACSASGGGFMVWFTIPAR
jgi:K+-sensing histidine kinase KdpD